MNESFKPNIPIGDSVDLQNKRETLNAVPVKNVVRWVNDGFETPFNFETGKPTSVGVFLTPREGDIPSFSMEVFPEHGRTSLFGRVIFKDKEGNLYRDIDLKGLGYIQTLFEGKFKVATAGYMPDGGHMGLMRMKTAEKDAQMAELLVKAGVRTDRVLAIIELEEIVDEVGAKMSVEKAKKCGVMKKDFVPVITVRAFGTRHRISDFRDSRNPLDVLKDVKTLVAQELGVDPATFTLKDYMLWFAKTLAKNMALMHSNGLYHNSLHEQNITLDCRIIDRDTMGVKSEMIKELGWRKTQEKFESDLVHAETATQSIFISLQKLSLLKGSDSGLTAQEISPRSPEYFYSTLLKVFNEEYSKRMGPALKISNKARNIFEKIKDLIYSN